MAFLGKHFMPPFLFLLISLLFLSTHATRSFSRQVRNSNNNPFSTNSKYEALQDENKDQRPFYAANYNPHGFGAPVVKSTPPPPPLPASVDELPVNYDANSYITSSETNQNQQHYQTNSEKDEFLTVAQRYGERYSSPAKVSTKYTNTEDQKEWIPANTKYQQQEYHQTNSKPKTVAERYEKTYSNKEEEQWSPAKTENQQEKYHQTNSKEQTDAEESYGTTLNPYKFYKKNQNDNEEDKTNNIPTTTVAERYPGNTKYENHFYSSNKKKDKTVKDEKEEEEDDDDLDELEEEDWNPKTVPQKYHAASEIDNKKAGEEFYGNKYNYELNKNKEKKENQVPDSKQFYYKDQQHDTPQTYGKSNKNFFENEEQLNELLSENDDQKYEDTNKKVVNPQTNFMNPYHQYQNRVNNKDQNPNYYQYQNPNNNPKDENPTFQPYGKPMGMSDTRLNKAQTYYDTKADTFVNPDLYKSAFAGDLSKFINSNAYGVQKNDP